MRHLVLGAFLSARIANGRANLADRSRKLAAAGHIADRQPAYFGAIDVELDTARHHGHILFLQACARAIIAGEGTIVTGVDARLELLMSHRRSPLESLPASHARVAATSLREPRSDKTRRVARICAAILAAVATSAFGQALVPERFGPNEGRVLEIDKSAGEITIRHGYLPELSMDPMSMIFVVADPALLDRVKAGDRVKFKAGLVAGRFAVVAIAPLKPRKEPRR
jgi:Cu(I)/Ag(I) efflux system periplasmic protein CusF